VQYRILFFYHGRNTVVLAHALTKEAAIPARDIERAKERKRRYEQEPSVTGRAKRSRKTHRTSDAVEILDRMIEEDVQTRELVERATVNAVVAS